MNTRTTTLALSGALVGALAGALALAGCGGKAVIDPVPCDALNCPDGYCDDAGACITRAQICARACEIIPVCMTPPKPTCYDFCFADLDNCSAPEMEATDVCTDTLPPDCDAADADAWLACVEAVPCLGPIGP